MPTALPTFDLDHLNYVLNQAGISDDSIIAGVQLTHRGYQKLAVKMGTDLKGIQPMLNQLISKLRDEQHAMSESFDRVLSEDDKRYSMEPDFLGNVTLRDDHTGEEKFMRAAQAAQLKTDLEHGDEQEVLAHWMSHPVTESLFEDDGYEDEIDTDYGTYNFPWKTTDGHGTATMEYSGKGKLKIVSVRDPEGNEIELTSDLNQALTPQAIAFIGKA